MIARKVAYIARDGNPVLTVQGYRNRKDRLLIADVTMDADGNISHRPIAKLACFASPIEYHRGLSDSRPTYKGQEGAPRWCAGCPSRPACGEFAERRVMMSADLIAKRDAWEVAAKALTGSARYEHPTFTEFATACDERGWTSDNDDALAERRAADAKRSRQARENARAKVKKAKTISPAGLAALAGERNERQAALTLAALAPGAPPRLRKLDSASIAFVCDVWHVRAAIERRYGGVVTGGDVTRAMVAAGLDHNKPEPSLRVRVNEAFDRIGKLESEPLDAPVWGDFVDTNEGDLPRTPRRFLYGVKWEVLEDA